MARSSPQKHLVAVGLKIWATFSSQAIGGILGFARKHRGYEFRDIVWSEAEQLPDFLQRLRPDGAILSLTSLEYFQIRDELPSGLPLVSIGADTLDDRVGVVCSDDRAMMTHAVDSLHKTGYRRIAFVGWEGSPGTVRRTALLRRVCRGAQAFNVRLHGPAEDLDAAMVRELKRWLRALQTPVGLIAWSGMIAAHVRKACEQIGRTVPNDVGILSLADDRPCLFGEPPISAMDVDGEQLGHQAMTMLAGLMRGETVPREPVMVPPTMVIARGSTAVEQRPLDSIDAALRFMDENATRGIVVKNVLATVPGIRRTRFYADFAERVGCTPADYIRRLKIDRAKELLLGTELTITRIAAMCGFASSTQLGDTFKREVGATPIAFRQLGSPVSARNDKN